MGLFRYHNLSSMGKVMAQKEPAVSAEPPQLSGLRSEILSFQIVYYWAGIEKQYGII